MAAVWRDSLIYKAILIATTTIQISDRQLRIQKLFTPPWREEVAGRVSWWHSGGQACSRKVKMTIRHWGTNKKIFYYRHYIATACTGERSYCLGDKACTDQRWVDSAFFFRTRSQKFGKNRTRSHFSISAAAGVCAVISQVKTWVN